MTIVASKATPINWINFRLNYPSIKLIKPFQQSELEQNSQFVVILNAKSVLSNDVVTVKEYFTDPNRRIFKFYVQEFLEA